MPQDKISTEERLRRFRELPSTKAEERALLKKVKEGYPAATAKYAIYTLDTGEEIVGLKGRPPPFTKERDEADGKPSITAADIKTATTEKDCPECGATVSPGAQVGHAQGHGKAINWVAAKDGITGVTKEDVMVGSKYADLADYVMERGGRLKPAANRTRKPRDAGMRSRGNAAPSVRVIKR